MADAHSHIGNFAPGLASGGGAATGAGRQQDVSVAGVLLLSAMSVTMAILGVVVLGVAVMGAWWLISHIPVPPAAMRLLAWMHLA